MKIKTSRNAFLGFIFIAAVALIIFEYFPPRFTDDYVLNEIIKVIITRSIGALIFIPLAVNLGYNIFGLTKRKRCAVLLCTLVPFAVVVNNLPIIGLLTGNAYIVKPMWYIALYACESFMIGLFEEFAFRGVLLPYVLEKRRYSARSIVWATIVSSAAFGAVHIFNLFAGGGIVGVILQIGYSFLIGGMCAIVLLYTRCIWLCVALHSIYDFCGYLVPKLGAGIIWDTATVIITAVLGVLAFMFMLAWLFKITPGRVNELYTKNGEASF